MLARRLAGAFAAQDAGVCAARLVAAGVPAVQVPDDFYERFTEDDQLFGAGLITTSDHPEFGSVRQPAMLVGLSENPGRPPRSAPALGHHTREILAEAGYAPAEIDALIARGIVGEPLQSRDLK